MKQMEVEVELRGPPAAKAFDQEGNPTKVGYPKRNRLLCCLDIGCSWVSTLLEYMNMYMQKTKFILVLN
jgi:hypothetical protein